VRIQYQVLLIRNLGEIPLTSEIIIKALELRRIYNITYFVSLHAASALSHDKIIISNRKISSGLKAINSREMLGIRCS